MSGLHVVQVNCAHHPQRLDGDALLAAWPTLPKVASAVAEAGVRLTVMQASHRDLFLRRGGVDYRFVREPTLRRRNWAGLRPGKLAGMARALDSDVIHVHGLGYPFHIRALCALGIPVLVQDHKNNPAPRLSPIHRFGLARVAGASFTAASQAEPFFINRLLPRSIPVFAIAEGSCSFTLGDHNTARALMGIEGNPALLWVGRLNSNKDPLTILDAVSLVARQRPSVRLWCAFHEAPLLDAVQRRIKNDALLSGRVHLLGALPAERIELLCRAADLFVLGSEWEGSGYALLEALACGLPPVVSDIAPFRQITDGGRIGALARRGDARGFAEGILRLSARAPSRQEVRRHFEAWLSFDAIGRQLVEAYGMLAGTATA